MTTPIRLEDRISTVLARDERLLEVLIAAAPAFEKLRSPLLRKTMSRLATVEQAARIAGLDAGDLLARLNGALTGEAMPAARAVTEDLAALPPELRELPAERFHDVDVREDLRAGREPFSRIMSAGGRVGQGEVLRVRAIFEPAPLYPVLAKQGFTHFTERLAADDWRVWFRRDGKSAPAERSAGANAEPSAEVSDPDVVVIDVRGLEPPEPMVRTLEALELLPRGKTLLQINVRVPQFLLPQLDARGFVYEIREQSVDLVRLFIRHASTQGES